MNNGDIENQNEDRTNTFYDNNSTTSGKGKTTPFSRIANNKRRAQELKKRVRNSRRNIRGNSERSQNYSSSGRLNNEDNQLRDNEEPERLESQKVISDFDNIPMNYNNLNIEIDPSQERNYTNFF